MKQWCLQKVLLTFIKEARHEKDRPKMFGHDRWHTTTQVIDCEDTEKDSDEWKKPRYVNQHWNF